MSEEEEKCHLLWKQHGHCFINLTPINQVTVTQFLLNLAPNVINIAALNNYMNEYKMLFQCGSTEMYSMHLQKGRLKSEVCQTLVNSLTGFTYKRDRITTQNGHYVCSPG